mgnify:CR=1 FL=1
MSSWRISPNYSVRQWTCQDFRPAIGINRRPLPTPKVLNAHTDDSPPGQIALSRPRQIVRELMTGDRSPDPEPIPDPFAF